MPPSLPSKQLEQIETWKEKEPGVELIFIDYKDVLFETEKMVNKVQKFIGKKLNFISKKFAEETKIIKSVSFSKPPYSHKTSDLFYFFNF